MNAGERLPRKLGSMLESLPLTLLVLIFAASAAAIWVAGVYLSEATDILSTRWGLGEALGGLILLALVTNLPEIAIVASGALRGELSLAVGNILGGVAVQTVVLVILDGVGVGPREPLTYRAASLTLVLEAVLVIAVLSVAVIGSQLPPTLIFARVTPQGLMIALLWMVGLWLIARARTGLPCWNDRLPNAPEGDEQEKQPCRPHSSTQRALVIFGLGAAVTLACGVMLETTGDAIASHIGMDGILFGATVLAAATSLPEVSTGLASVKLKDYQLAVSDILGGNAFLPVLFLLATLISGQAVLPHAQKTDIYLTGLGILLTCVYLVGLIFRSRRQVAGLGLDSLVVLLLYVLGIAGLFVIAP